MDHSFHVKNIAESYTKVKSFQAGIYAGRAKHPQNGMICPYNQPGTWMGSTASIMAGDKGDHMRPKYTTLIFLLLAAFLLAGCADIITNQPTNNDKKATPEVVATEDGQKSAIPSETPVDSPSDRNEQRPSQTPPPGLERVEITPPVPVSGEVPDEIMSEIIVDLMNISGTAREDILVVRAEAVVWNDGSLGCAKPGEFYIQMMINGYWVVLEVEGVEYDYRVSDKGSFKLCEGENMPPISPPQVENPNPLVTQAKEDLAERLGIPTTEIELLSFDEVVWPDASLGCPQPGMRYKQVPYDGALIRLSVVGQVYDYHSGGSRGVFLCEISTKSTKSAPQIDLVPPPGSADD
jgi:hypothetical protein